MELNDFDYALPQDLIAHHPLHKRDNARLLVADSKRQKITHDIFCNINQYLPESSSLVLNNSKVIPARLLTHREKTGGQVELFLLKKLEDGYSYKVLMRPTKRLKVKEDLFFDQKRLKATIIDKEKGIVRFNRKNVMTYLRRIGHIPLPPYISREDTAEDKKYYQTVYARAEGSVAAPTAGLHFTKGLLRKIEQAGHTIQFVTLHVSYGTFKPVETQDITKHEMHFEEYCITPDTKDFLEQQKLAQKKIVAVGTTSCRVLETIACKKEYQGNTNMFIYPGYQFKMTNALITNFHLPRSTLFMLVCALGGTSFMKKAYRIAVEEKYRFYSYGDAMLIL